MDVIAEIDHDIRIYMGVKTLASTITAALSWAIMTFVGLDFAEFWALLIFLFNFIPNIGSLIATALPTVLALAQFDTLRPFAIVGIGVTAVQLLVANVIEPNLTGKSLNMSPLVVMLALVLWGMMWGAVGMLLCVPITAVIMIILSHFPSTRWIPILLSKDGGIREAKQLTSS
jgi:predicted PurR-regulated permease PerM